MRSTQLAFVNVAVTVPRKVAYAAPPRAADPRARARDAHFRSRRRSPRGAPRARAARWFALRCAETARRRWVGPGLAARCSRCRAEPPPPPTSPPY